LLRASGLVAKDRNLITRKKTTSDPFCVIYVGSRRVGTSATKYKTLDPVWNQSFLFEINERQSQINNAVVALRIFDEDKLSAPDPMGKIELPIDIGQSDVTRWIDIPPDSAKNATGKVQVRIQIQLTTSKSLVRGNVFELGDRVKVGLAWDMLPGNQNVDLDVSCVALTREGQISMADTVYYGNVANTNQSVVHSGDEREGDEIDDDEAIAFYLDLVPTTILAMYILLTVHTPDRKISDIQSATLRVYDVSRGSRTLCTFTPGRDKMSQDATAMFMVRLSRKPQGSTWILSPIEDTHPTARDFGSLLPFMKSYTRDLLPNIVVDPTERVAILQKGGAIRLSDYSPHGQVPRVVRFGLAWDLSNGKNIDLDASAVCLDKSLNLMDQVWFKQLRSVDGAIRHHGDEREGDELGDDEKMDIELDKVSDMIHYIGFVINSYSGQELDDVQKASCHLFDPQSGPDMASYALSNTDAVNGYTALVVACLYRSDDGSSWDLCIISEPAHGRTVRDNVDELQNYLHRNPPHAPPAVEEGEIIVDAEMPGFVPLEDDEIDLSKP